MNLDKYRIKAPTSFDRYYYMFLHNSGKQKNYKIDFDDYTSYIGIPTCDANVSTVNVSFYFKMPDGSAYKIPFSELKQATLVED